MTSKIVTSLQRLERYQRHLIDTLVFKREAVTKRLLDLDKQLQQAEKHWMTQIEIVSSNPWCSGTFHAYREQWRLLHARLIGAKIAAQDEQTKLIEQITYHCKRLKKYEVIRDKITVKSAAPSYAHA